MTKTTKEYEGMTAIERTKVLQEKLKTLMQNIIRSPEQMRKFASSWRTGFHTYSFRNQVLILLQFPKATLSAGRGIWIKRHKRDVKPAEVYNAQWILAPQFKKVQVTIYKRDKDGKRISDGNGGYELETVERDKLSYFKSVPVYDVSQTAGEELDIGMNSSKFEGKEFTVDSMIKCFPKYEVKMVESGTDGYAKHDSNIVGVAKRKNKAQEVASLFHEVAHHELGHTDTKKRNTRFEGIKTNQEVKEIIELEAQAVAFLVCSCVGIDELEGSADYIANWNGNVEAIERSAEKVMSTADRMIKQIAKCVEKK